VRAESGTIDVAVSRVQCLSYSDLKVIIRDYCTLFDDIPKIFFETAACSLCSALLPRALGIDEVMQTPSFANVVCKFMSHKLIALIGDK
jgi:hypothetical protein